VFDNKTSVHLGFCGEKYVQKLSEEPQYLRHLVIDVSDP
jgi:hypothetical protein